MFCDLLPHLLDEHLELERAVRRPPGCADLGGERVGLAVQLLRDEVQPFPDWRTARPPSSRMRSDLAEVRAQPRQLLVDVDLGGEHRAPSARTRSSSAEPSASLQAAPASFAR